MQVEKKDLEKSQVELNVELTLEEFEPYIKKGVEFLSKEVKVDGFRPGKVPFDVLKKKIGEMTILEEAARIAINKTLGEVIKNNIDKDSVGQPRVDITKLAPENPMAYKAIVAVVPEITLGDYKDAKVKRKKAEVDKEDTERMLRDLREMRVKETIVDREIGENDKAIIDIEMFLDKVPVEGGQTKDAAIILGKNYVVAGFDKKIIGAKKGDEREFSLPYPAEYHMKNLAGKMVDFKIKVKDVYSRELPELNDDFAIGFGAKKIEELKTNIEKTIKEQKEKELKQLFEKSVIEKVLAKTKFGDIPEVLIEHETRTMMAELEQTIEQQGGKFEDYLQSLGKTMEQMTLDIMPDAVKRVKVSLMIREIASIEKIKVSDEELNEHMDGMKKHYKDDKNVIEKISTPEYRAYVTNILNSRKVVDKLCKWNLEI
jgi:trigger factor